MSSLGTQLDSRPTISNLGPRVCVSPKQISVGVCLFLSGLSSLTYQVIWQRVLSQEIGVDSVSMAVVVSVFMVGFGLGTLFGGFLAGVRHFNLVVGYAVAEFLIGGLGLFSVDLLRTANRIAAQFGWEGVLYDFLINLATLIAPTFLMGMTTPMITEWLSTSESKVGRLVGIFYGLNVLGAAAGALLAGFLFIELFGLRATARLAAILNLFVGVLAITCLHSSRKKEAGENPASANPAEIFPSRFRFSSILACICFGFVTLAFEVVTFRILAVCFESHVHVFPMMLCCFLLTMGLGDMLSGLVVDRAVTRYPLGWLMALFFLMVITTVVVLHIPVETWRAAVPRSWILALLLVPLLVFPVLFQSALFPTTIAMVAGRGQRACSCVGKVLFWYTAGNLLGCAFTALFLVGAIGTINIFRLCFALVLLGAFLLTAPLVKPSKRVIQSAICGVAILVFGVCLVPENYFHRLRPCTEYQEGPEGVVTYREGFPLGGIQVNGTPAAQVYRSIQPLVSREHNLTGLFQVDPGFQPRRILIIGVGPADLVWAMREHDVVENMTVVELSPEVIGFVRKHSAPDIVAALDDPRVKIVIGDGRRFLNRAATHGQQYDLIQVGTFYPDVAGSANLYSRDLLTNARHCLAPQGYFMTLDCAGIVPTAHAVFANGMILIGTPNYMFFFDHELDATKPNASSSSVRLLDPARFADYPVTTDDTPTFEFRFLRELLDHPRSLRARIHQMPVERYSTTFAAAWPE
ncbi:MAG: fused MFS/spermidine synthase [Planctomycetota bacterium]